LHPVIKQADVMQISESHALPPYAVQMTEWSENGWRGELIEISLLA